MENAVLCDIGTDDNPEIVRVMALDGAPGTVYVVGVCFVRNGQVLNFPNPFVGFREGRYYALPDAR